MTVSEQKTTGVLVRLELNLTKEYWQWAAKQAMAVDFIASPSRVVNIH